MGSLDINEIIYNIKNIVCDLLKHFLKQRRPHWEEKFK